ncbi:MAG: hypothetical protein IJW24_01430 [Clostridia bacterium]|nr:hypothetical protein [Clostridia bacterium]
MEQPKKPHVKIGTIGHVGYGKRDLDSAIETLLKTPEMHNKNQDKQTLHQEQRPRTLSEQLMRDYEIKARMEEMRWLEETGYYDELYAKFKKYKETTKADEEAISEK